MSKDELGLVGETFGRLLVVRFLGGSKNHYECKCDCGNSVFVSRRNLMSGTTASCGCLHRDSASMSIRIVNTHSSWSAMKDRCFNPNSKDYPNWGGRGITVCERWLDFDNFLEDMGPRPIGTSLGRINNDGNYEPGNCEWQTPAQQQRNKRNTNTIVFDGVVKSAAEVAQLLGLDRQTLLKRLKSRMDPRLVVSPELHPTKFGVLDGKVKVGDMFGAWTVLNLHREESTAPNTDYSYLARCRCICGAEKDVEIGALLSGASKSCGCKGSGRKSTNTIGVGDEFGEWTVVEVFDKVLPNGQKKQFCTCICSCTATKDVDSYTLRSGKSTSCGCKAKEPKKPRPDPKPRVRTPTIPKTKEPTVLRADIKNTVVKFDGKKMTLGEWAEHTNIPYQILKCRYEQGHRGAYLFDPNLHRPGPKPGSPRQPNSGRKLAEAGERFGKLVVQSLFRAPSGKQTITKANCVCDCGNTKVVAYNNLKRGLQISCGCEKAKRIGAVNKDKFTVKSGDTFGRLTVANVYSKSNITYADCVCSCGTKKTVEVGNLKRSNTVSCGCKNRERMLTNNPAKLAS